MLVARVAGLAAPLYLAAALALNGSNAMAQSADTVPLAPAAGAEGDRPTTLAQSERGGGRAPGVRSSAGSRGGGAMARSRAGRIRAPQTQRFVGPRAPRIQSQRPRIQSQRPRIPSQLKRRAPSRIVVPRRPLAPKAAPRRVAPVPRFRLQATRRAPTSLGLVNRGLRRNPGRGKPAAIAHHPDRRAGRSGWMHRYRPFVFKHDGHRWRRHYYTFLVGGLWYWYWYDVIADTDPAAVVYSEIILPACELDSDECVDAPLIAPALLEGRATQEAMDRCAAELASFDPETGTYLTGDGEMRVCPYLE
jgi:hypothetical protein